jgi:pimeloyl-ACP methyl ester carboxylesterase
VSLAVRESGVHGQTTIVLLHGVGNNGSMWSHLVASLPEYHCLVPDLPGHGDSRAFAWRSRAETARMVGELIDARATDGRAHVVGLSLGGSVALELLASRPELLDHVVVDGCAALPSPVIGPMKAGVFAISPLLRFGPVARLIGRAFGVQPGDGLTAFVTQMQAVDPKSFRRAFADANDVRVTPSLLAAPCPTLLVAGERELRHVRASNRLLAERMPHGEARMVPRANHGWGPAQYPDLHRRMIVAWLQDQPLPDELARDASTSAGNPSPTESIGELR